MMIGECEKTETNVTRWKGELPAGFLTEALTEAIRKDLGIPAYTPGLTLQVTLRGSGTILELDRVDLASFDLVQDHHYYRKPVADPE